MAYISRSCDLLGMRILKIESLMAYVSNIFVLKIPKISRKQSNVPQKEILMADIIRSCDFPKVKMGRWVAYIII
jgi:hypothetical protein